MQELVVERQVVCSPSYAVTAVRHITGQAADAVNARDLRLANFATHHHHLDLAVNVDDCLQRSLKA